MNRDRWLRGAMALALVCVLGSGSLRAQAPEVVPVFDASNFIEAVAQVVYMFDQIEYFLYQAQRLPVNMAARYHATSPPWTANATGAVSAGPLLAALNVGDATGNAYQQVIDPLDGPTNALAHVPAALQRRLLDSYATIQLADSVATLGVDQSGTVRTNGNALLQVLQSMEADAFSVDDTFHTETGLLNKINSTSLLGAKVGEQTNQFLSSVIEQLLVETKRTRDTEARLMDATLNQWQYGGTYGSALFQNTAADLDSWRLH